MRLARQREMGSELSIDSPQGRAHGVAQHVESEVLQLFEADATLKSPAVCSAI